MKDEIAKVIAMAQEGKVSAEEASELIQLIGEKENAVKSSPATKPTENYLQRSLRIKIQSGKTDKVNVSIPLKLIKLILKMGHGIAGNIPEAKEYTEHINVELIMEAIEQEMVGDIVNIETEDGDTVLITIE